ncbi:MAG: hypothetical protein KDD60_10080 [Bdellovibrionales bacterium]|nr:hypothetical protein [Bdellovibrionales bacterium]
MESLSCLKCSAPLSDKDVNPDLGIAKCKYCDAWMKLSDFQKEPKPLPKESRRKELPVPRNIQISETEEKLTISVTPSTGSGGFGIVGSILGGVVAVVFLMFFMSFANSMGAPPLFIFAPLLMMVFVVGSILMGIAKNEHKSRLRVVNVIKGQHLQCQSPGFGGTPERLPLETIKQLYCTEEYEQEYNNSNKAYRSITFYNVNALMTDDSSRHVMTGLQTKQEAFLVEGKIEHFLDLPDNPVAGEIS